MFISPHVFFFSVACLSDRNCKSGERCESGQCKSWCSQRNACGVNALCDASNHKKKCSCPPDFTGNPEVECVRVPSTCVADSTCPGGMRCHEGICMLKCTGDNRCAHNERCHGGKCMRKFTIVS